MQIPDFKTSTESLKSNAVLQLANKTNKTDLELIYKGCLIAAEGGADGKLDDEGKKCIIDRTKKYRLPNTDFYFLCCDNKRVGMFCISKPKNNTVGIEEVAIFPEYQGKGFGKLGIKLVLEQIKKQYKDVSIDLFVSSTNTKAINLYKSFGFKIEKTITGGPRDQYVMKLDKISTESLKDVIITPEITTVVISPDEVHSAHRGEVIHTRDGQSIIIKSDGNPEYMDINKIKLSEEGLLDWLIPKKKDNDTDNNNTDEDDLEQFKNLFNLLKYYKSIIGEINSNFKDDPFFISDKYKLYSIKDCINYAKTAITRYEAATKIIESYPKDESKLDSWEKLIKPVKDLPEIVAKEQTLKQAGYLDISAIQQLADLHDKASFACGKMSSSWDDNVDEPDDDIWDDLGVGDCYEEYFNRCVYDISIYDQLKKICQYVSKKSENSSESLVEPSNEMLLYAQFFRRFIVRRISDFSTVHPLAELEEWPRGCILHDIWSNFLMNKQVTLVPDPQAPPYVREPIRKYIYHQIFRPVTSFVLYWDDFTLPNNGVTPSLINFRKKYQRTWRQVSSPDNMPSESRSNCFNIISYESLYRARVLGLDRTYRRMRYILTSVLNQIGQMPDRENFIVLPVGNTHYERPQFVRSFVNHERPAIKYPNDYWFLFLMHFYGFLYPDKTQSVFDEIPDKVLKNINLVFFSKTDFVAFNMLKLKELNKQSASYILKVIALMNRLADNGYTTGKVDYGDISYKADTTIDKTEIIYDEDSNFDDDDSATVKAIDRMNYSNTPVTDDGVTNVYTVDNDTEEDEDEDVLDESTSDIASDPLPVPDSFNETPEETTDTTTKKTRKTVSVANKVSKYQLDKDIAEDISDLNIDVKITPMMAIPDEYITVKEDNNLNITSYKEPLTTQETKENNDNFLKEIEEESTKAIDEAEDLTKAQKAHATTMSQAWKDIKLTDDKTLADVMETPANETIDENKVAGLDNDVDIVDKSMLNSTIENFDQKYMSTLFFRDLIANLITFNKFGMFLKDFKVIDVSDSLNSLQEVAIKFEDIHHKEHSFKFTVPIVDKRGFIKLNGTTKVLKKQRIDLPLCKVSSERVRLSSDYNKYLVERNGNTTHNYLAYVGRILRKADPSTINVVYNTINLSRVKLPYEYTQLASKYESIEIDGMRGLNMYFNYHKRVEWLAAIGLGKEGIAKVLANESKYHAVIYAIDNDKRQYLAKLDGSTLVIDTDSKVQQTSSLDILCDECNADIAALSEWTDMVLLNMTVPVIFALAYRFGLSNILNYTKTKYRVINKGETSHRNWSDIVIRFKDKTLIVPRYPLVNSLLFAGLNNYKLNDIRMEDMDSKDIYYDLLRSKDKSIHFLKGIDNYFDLFMDAITRDVLLQMREPTNTKDLLIRATQLLSTEDHKPAASASNFRFRSYERINTAIYKTLATTFANYRVKGLGATYKWSFADYEIIKMLTEDQLLENVDTINPVNEAKYKQEYSHAGTGGRKSVDTFMVDDRQFPDDGIGTMSEAVPDNSKTGFAGSVSTDPTIVNMRGMTETVDPDKLTPTQVLSVTSLLFPFATTDDGKRANFINIHSSHYVGVQKMHVNRVRTGYDKILAHRVAYPFAQVAREDGKVIFFDEDKKILKIKYKSGAIEAFRWGDEYTNNGGGGFWCTQNVINNGFKLNDTVKRGDVVVYNNRFFGKDIFSKQVIWKMGRMTNTAIIECDGTLDDACKISNVLAKDLAFNPVHVRDINLDINTNVHQYAAVGTDVRNIDPILIYDQSAINEDDFGALDPEAIGLLAKLNRSTPKAKFSGKVVKIEAFYKASVNSMSPSLRKIINSLNRQKMSIYNEVSDSVNANSFDKETKIERSDRIGMTDLGDDNVILRFYIQQDMGMQAGSKIEFSGSLKSVCSEVTDEPWELDDGSTVDALFSGIGISNRIVVSPIRQGLINKVLGDLEQKMLNEYYKK